MIRTVVKIVTLLLASMTLFAASKESKILEVKLNKPSVNVIADLAYTQTQNPFGQVTQLNMDILKPNSKTPLPAVLFITGGGFVQSPKENYIQQRLAIAEAGYVVASIEYRVVPNTTFPEPLEDAKTAVRYLKENAKKYGIDPNRIAVMGESAGGYLSALVGTTNGMKEFDKGEYLNQNSDVQAAIDIYGLSDLTKVGDDYSKEIQEVHKSAAAPEAMLVNGIAVFGPGGSILSNLDKAKAANPLTYISKNTPPFLVMHGDNDMLVSPSQTKILHEALIDKGIDSTRYIVKGANHADQYWCQKEVLDVIIGFLDKNLKK